MQQLFYTNASWKFSESIVCIIHFSGGNPDPKLFSSVSKDISKKENVAKS